MKKILVSLAMISFMSNSYAVSDKDKIGHFTVSAMLGVIGNKIAGDELSVPERVFLGAFLGTLPGLYKEIIDKNNKHFSDSQGFSKRDLLVDMLGAAAGSMLGEGIRIYGRQEPKPTIYIAYTGKF